MRNIVGLVAVLWLASGLVGAFAYEHLDSRAGAAPPPPSATQVREQNLDGSGLIRVHEQGTANVAGTVNVGNLPVDSAGNVRVNLAGPTGPFEYTNVVASICPSVPSGFCRPQTVDNFDVNGAVSFLGSQGWELVTTAGTGGNEWGQIVWTFRRAVP